MFIERVSGFTAGSYWTEKLLVVVIPQLLWFPAIRRNPIWLLLISAGIIVGMWLERYVFIVSSLYRNHIPTWWFPYAPTFWDWMLLAGSIGLFLTLFFVCLRLLPIVSMSEMREIVDKASQK